MPPKFAPKGRALFTHFHALAAVTVSIRLSYSRGKPCFGPPSRVHSHLPALPRSHRPQLARKAVPKRYSSRSPVSRLSDLRLLYHHKTRLSTPNFAAPCHPPHPLFPKSLCAGGEEISPRYSFKGGLRGLGCRLGRRWTVATGDHRPFASPHGGEHSPAPPSTRRGFGLGCRLGRSWTVPTGHQDPLPPVRACLTPILFFFFGLLKGWTRLPHSGRCHRRAMMERASSKFRCTKCRGIFLSYPATGRKNRGFAGVKFLQTKTPVSERSERIGVFPVLSGHGQQKGQSLRSALSA